MDSSCLAARYGSITLEVNSNVPRQAFICFKTETGYFSQCGDNGSLNGVTKYGLRGLSTLSGHSSD